MAAPNETFPAVFLDRDGTVMEDVNYCATPEQVKVFPGAVEALRKLKTHGFKIFIITNQSGIGRGYFSEAEYRRVEAEFLRQLGDDLIDATYFSADKPDSNSPRRKPEPEMVFEAAREHRLDLSRSFFVGDKEIDVECGRNAGVRTVLVRTGYGKRMSDCGADWVARDLAEAADIIIEHAK